MHAALKRIGNFLSMLSISRTDGGVHVWTPAHGPECSSWLHTCVRQQSHLVRVRCERSRVRIPWENDFFFTGYFFLIEGKGRFEMYEGLERIGNFLSMLSISRTNGVFMLDTWAGTRVFQVGYIHCTCVRQ